MVPARITSPAKGIKAGWYGGAIGGYLFLPIISFVFFHMHQYGYGIFCMTLFIFGMVYALLVTPWKYPGTSYGKLMIPLLAPLMLLCLLVAVFKPVYQGQTVNIWQIICLIPLFAVPIFTSWDKTYNKMTGKQKLES